MTRSGRHTGGSTSAADAENSGRQRATRTTRASAAAALHITEKRPLPSGTRQRARTRINSTATTLETGPKTAKETAEARGAAPAVRGRIRRTTQSGRKAGKNADEDASQVDGPSVDQASEPVSEEAVTIDMDAVQENAEQAVLDNDASDQQAAAGKHKRRRVATERKAASAEKSDDVEAPPKALSAANVETQNADSVAKQHEDPVFSAAGVHESTNTGASDAVAAASNIAENHTESLPAAERPRPVPSLWVPAPLAAIPASPLTDAASDHSVEANTALRPRYTPEPSRELGSSFAGAVTTEQDTVVEERRAYRAAVNWNLAEPTSGDPFRIANLMQGTRLLSVVGEVPERQNAFLLYRSLMEWAELGVQDDDREAAMLRRIYAFLRWTFEPDPYTGHEASSDATCPPLTEDDQQVLTVLLRRLNTRLHHPELDDHRRYIQRRLLAADDGPTSTSPAERGAVAVPSGSNGSSATTTNGTRARMRNRPTPTNPLALASGRKDLFEAIGERHRRRRRIPATPTPAPGEIPLANDAAASAEHGSDANQPVDSNTETIDNSDMSA
ncbi:hypothetical protein THASP1DRAFT_30731 [Thamnocephalis sphaerospora]|uniref:Uncharacterized protein n=1 Tax=Thamnocephalis sphaerospora TaxID=78915 RepID=A0A4V1IWG2_9FUNG|nr:hypothetical protein THASP1DRAFT_30731 [Thamnocephalis sphaerospora]|eukprot:RKP07449.1 hypothetical protein THASP1DRAFT_30731 [Thamnocephalis sphaerospora]